MIQYQPHNQSVDIWALGILCFELLTGRTPFGVEEPEGAPPNLEAAYDCILRGQVIYPDDVSEGARAFISKVSLYKFYSFICKLNHSNLVA